MSEKAKIIVYVNGGVVQSIKSNIFDMEAIIVDSDHDGDEVAEKCYKNAVRTAESMENSESFYEVL